MPNISKVLPINTPILHIPTKFVTERLCGSINKENNLILSLETDTPPQLSDNLTIPSSYKKCEISILIKKLNLCISA